MFEVSKGKRKGEEGDNVPFAAFQSAASVRANAGRSGFFFCESCEIKHMTGKLFFKKYQK
jgi:hypothetical protein